MNRSRIRDIYKVHGPVYPPSVEGLLNAMPGDFIVTCDDDKKFRLKAELYQQVFEAVKKEC